MDHTDQRQGVCAGRPGDGRMTTNWQVYPSQFFIVLIKFYNALSALIFFAVLCRIQHL